MNKLRVPVMELFPLAQVIHFNEIMEGDVIGVIDRVTTGNSLRLNIATSHSHINTWTRLDGRNTNNSVADACEWNIFLICRTGESQKITHATQQELVLRNLLHEHVQATPISYDEITQGELLGSIQAGGHVLIDYAYSKDKYGWYTENNKYIAENANPSYRFNI